MHEKGAEFVATSYWCFEDLYLSYDEVLAMYLKNPVAENVVIAALQYVHDNLQNGTDYLIPVARFRTLLIYITAQEKQRTLCKRTADGGNKGIKRERSFCDNEISGSVPEIGGMLVERLQ